MEKSLKEQYEEVKAEQREQIDREETEVEKYNEELEKNITPEIKKHYKRLYVAIDKLVNGFVNLVFVKGMGGIGKSVNIRKALKESDSDFVEINGDVTDAYLYRLFYEHNGKVLWFKDVAKLLNGLNSVNKLKVATETEDKRVLTKSNYSKQQEDLPNSFIFKGKLIFDYNNLTGIKRTLRADFDALKSRGIFIELAFSKADIKEMMLAICKDDEQKLVTEFLINAHSFNGENFLNLRTQYHAFQSYLYAKKKKLEWRDILIDDLTKQQTETQCLLYSIIGKKAMRTTELKALLLKTGLASSISTANRRINEWLLTEDLYKISSEERDFYVCIVPLNKSLIGGDAKVHKVQSIRG